MFDREHDNRISKEIEDVEESVDALRAILLRVTVCLGMAVLFVGLFAYFISCGH